MKLGTSSSLTICHRTVYAKSLSVGWLRQPEEHVPAGPAREYPRIVGGTVTTIDHYPFAAAMLAAWGATYRQSCAGSILTARSILSAAHCYQYLNRPSQWRSRVGSSWANSGGCVYHSAQMISHPNYDPRTQDNDFAIIRVETPIQFVPNLISAAIIAGPNYYLADNQALWAIGWGTTSWGGSSSEQLRHVQLWAVSQAACRQRYAELRLPVTERMLCAGWLDAGGRDQCQGDSGGPLIHNDVVVGVCSWGYQCAHTRYPGVNARVSSASDWIVGTA